MSFSSPDPGAQFVSRDPVPIGWATWNAPPNVETSTPKVAQDEVNATCAICTLLISFSTPVKTFGFEAEPDPFPTMHTISANFLNGATTVGNVSTTFAGGNFNARLFAGTTDQQFTSVQVTVDGTDFATAQFRFSAQTLQDVPEPGTMLLTMAGLVGLCYRQFRRA